jgi:DNA-binding NtrC family response regulator
MCHEPQVLLLCADPAVRADMLDCLMRSGAMPLVCQTSKDAQNMLSRQSVSVAFCEDVLLNLFNHELSPMNHAPLVVISRTGGRAEYLEALISGAFEFVMLPAPIDEIRTVLRRALRAAGAEKSIVRKRTATVTN